MTGETDLVKESNRDRVRRILLRPLDLRFPAKGRDARSEDEGRAVLDQIADELGRLSDAQLAAMVEPMRRAAEGKPFWPSRGAFMTCAEWIAPMPLAMSPALLSWFASIEGPRAIAEGTLVETWAWFERRKVPPHCPPLRQAEADSARRRIASDAAEAQHRLTVIADRRERAVSIDPDDLAWERWYLDRQRQCVEAVERVRAEKGQAA